MRRLDLVPLPVIRNGSLQVLSVVNMDDRLPLVKANAVLVFLLAPPRMLETEVGTLVFRITVGGGRCARFVAEHIGYTAGSFLMSNYVPEFVPDPTYE